MVLSNALDTVHGHIDLLAWPQLGDENIGVRGAHGVGREGLDLLAGGLENEVTGVHGVVLVELVGVGFGFFGAGEAFAGSAEVEDDGVFVGGVAGGFSGGGFYGVC